MNNAYKILAGGVRVLSVLLGGFCFLWALFCFLGGPEGKTWSKESFFYGFVFMAIGWVIILAGKKLRQAVAGKIDKS